VPSIKTASWRKRTKQRNQLLKVDVSFAIP
jgi:hypothetical protein